MTEHEAFLALNRESEALLYPLDETSLAELLRTAYVAWLSPEHDAMLIALNECALYESPNFAWFKERYDRFVYVDRVAVAERSRGRGIARRLYEQLIARASADGYRVLCAEIYSAPPNPGSDAFHEALGFREVGRAHLHERGKSVRYLVRPLTTE